MRIYDTLREALKAKEDRIMVLERENTELKAKYQALHQRQFKPNRKRQEPAAAKNPEVKRKRRGAPAGHPGWFRSKPTCIDRTIIVAAPARCPYCHRDNLQPLAQTNEHIQQDLVPPPPPIMTRYVHHQAWCPTCGKVVSQAGDAEMPGAHIGPLAKATAIYLRQDIGVTYRKVARLFKELFGLSFVPASALGFDRRATSRGTPLYEDLREKIRLCAVAHADETSWRNDGLGHFAWYAGNDDLAFFHIDRHRSAEVARAIFGKHFNGVLVRDRYAAYNGIGLDWQACLAHIRRNAKDITREHALLPPSDRDPNADAFTAAIMRFCSLACNIGQKLKSGKLPWEKAEGLEKLLRRQLNRICKQPLRFKPAETLRSYLAGPEQKHLLTFLRHHGVPPTNNHAEQSIRRLVIFRKISFGTRSQSGLKTHSVLPSLLLTAKRQGVEPMKFLRILLTRDTATAQATLYNDSS